MRYMIFTNSDSVLVVRLKNEVDWHWQGQITQLCLNNVPRQVTNKTIQYTVYTVLSIVSNKTVKQLKLIDNQMLFTILFEFYPSIVLFLWNCNYQTCVWTTKVASPRNISTPTLKPNMCVNNKGRLPWEYFNYLLEAKSPQNSPESREKYFLHLLPSFRINNLQGGDAIWLTSHTCW